MPCTIRNTRVLCATALACAATLWSANARAADGTPASLPSEVDKISYTIGVQFANSVKADGVKLNVAAFAQAMTDVLGNRPLAMSEADMNATMAKFSHELAARQQTAQAAMAREQLAAGQAFLADNAKRAGVQVLPSGLQYEVLQPGSGAAPAATDSVVAHYRGTLIDGTEFDSSYSRGEPAQFPLGGVIDGWTEALQLMQEGAKWKLYIPSNLAYGAQGRPPAIPPNATLVFEVELVKVVKP